MAIWAYQGVSREPQYVWSEGTCRFCKEKMALVHSESEDCSNVKVRSTFEKRLWVCPVCGWWNAHGWRDDDQIVHRGFYQSTFGAAASLRELDLTDISIPVGDVRSYLAAKYERRFDLHPRLFEETVAAVFRDLGYDVVVTAYSGDDGIDVILQRGSETIGVQVKRYKNKITVDQIRSLAGALVLAGMTRGIFVTTSTFQRGGPSTAKRLAVRGYEIELLDAPRFYDALKLAQRNMYTSIEDFPVADSLARLVKIDERRLDDEYSEFFRRI